MLVHRLSRCLRTAPSIVQKWSAARRITVDVYQTKKREMVYEGPNAFLHPSRPEKLEEMAAFRDPLEDTSMEQREAVKTIKRLIKQRNYSDAVATFRQVSERNGGLYSVALSACAKGVLSQDAMEIWAEMPEKYKSNVTYSTMLDVCRRSKKVQLAESLMAEMSQRGITPNIVTYRTLLGVYSMVGDTERAMDIFKTVRETCFPGASQVSKQMTYLVIMTCFARKGDYRTVKELFDEMTSAGIPPDHTHFNSLLTASITDGHVDIAEAIIEIMPKWGLNPRTEDFTALISACRSDLPRCKAAYAKMKEAGVAPSFRTYKNLILAHDSAGDHEGAKALLVEAQNNVRCDERELERLQYQLRVPIE